MVTIASMAIYNGTPTMPTPQVNGGRLFFSCAHGSANIPCPTHFPRWPQLAVNWSLTYVAPTQVGRRAVDPKQATV